MRQLLCVCLSILIFSASASAASTTGFFFNNLRQMSMGGVGVTISDGDLGLVNNPAGLADVKGFRFKLPRILGGVGTEMIDKTDEFKELLTSNDEDRQLELLKSFVPYKTGAEFNMVPVMSFVVPNFGVGVFAGGLVFPKIYRKTSPQLKVDGFMDVAPAIGYGRFFNVFEQEIALGASVKYVNRTRYKVEMSTSELIDAVNSKGKIVDLNEFNQTTVAFDIGMLGKWQNEGIDARYGFSIKNIGAKMEGTRTIINKAGLSVEETVTEEVPVIGTFGVGMKTSVPLLYDITLAADYDLISEGSFFRRLHLGFEKKLFVFNLRGGLNQGNVVGGFGLDLWILHLDYAYNVREFGDKIGQDRVQYHVIEIGLI